MYRYSKVTLSLPLSYYYYGTMKVISLIILSKGIAATNPIGGFVLPARNVDDRAVRYEIHFDLA